MPKALTENTLFYGDNLDILREYVGDETIDLIYLDPPFNSNRSYNVLFKDESGKEAEAQITAFEDTWHWGEDAERTFHELIQNAPAHVTRMISALRDFIGTNQMMAYLVMMTARLLELHRVLKPTGSLYLHCDPTASHYLKVVMDTIFGVQNYRNEITWKRTTSHSDAKKFPNISDTILYYSRSEKCIWNEIRAVYDEGYIERYYSNFDKAGRRFAYDNLTKPKGSIGYFYELLGCVPPPNGWRMPETRAKQWLEEGRIEIPPSGKTPRYKRYLDELKGKVVGNIWDDIPPVNSQAKDALGYPTQKPLELLERIVKASSNEGDIVLDPFCGCGTAIAAAHKLGRRWIGIDVTHLSISLMKYRLKDNFDLKDKQDYQVIGEPESLSGAYQLAQDNRFQFQWWALSLIQAKPLGGDGGKQGKKGADKGIDGVLNFLGAKDKLHNVLVQVKSGHVSSRDIRDLRGVVEREDAAIGVFVTLEPPSRDMITEAVSAGYYHSQAWNKDYPKIQILTVEDLLAGKGVDMPSAYGTFKEAKRIHKDDASQPELL